MVKRLKISKDWEQRKKEIFKHFDREVYGRLPKNIPEVTWKIIAEQDSILGGYPVLISTLEGIVDNS